MGWEEELAYNIRLPFILFFWEMGMERSKEKGGVALDRRKNAQRRAVSLSEAECCGTER